MKKYTYRPDEKEETPDFSHLKIKFPSIPDWHVSKITGFASPVHNHNFCYYCGKCMHCVSKIKCSENKQTKEHIYIYTEYYWYDEEKAKYV